MRSPTLVRSKHRDGSVGSSSCGAHSLATSKLRGQSVSTEDTKPWWMTSWQSHGPTRAGSCLSEAQLAVMFECPLAGGLAAAYTCPF